MKRLIVVAATMAALLSLGAGQALAGNHSGPEAYTKGSGSTGTVTSTTTTPINATICDTSGYCYGEYPVAEKTVANSTTESFDFSAKSGPQSLTPIDPTDGPYGTMKLNYAQTTTTTTAADPIYGVFCDPNYLGGFYYVVGGCPTFGTTTTSKNATATAAVTCLNVVNNTAAIGGHVTKFSGDFPPTAGLLFNVTDNTIAGQQVAPDLFDGAFVAQAPQVCPAPSGGHPITSGDIYVDQS